MIAAATPMKTMRSEESSNVANSVSVQLPLIVMAGVPSNLLCQASYLIHGDDVLVNQSYKKLLRGSRAEPVDDMLHRSRRDGAGVNFRPVDEDLALSFVRQIPALFQPAQESADACILERVFRQQRCAHFVRGRKPFRPDEIEDLLL
jgi:hypothetical protein